MFGFGPGLLASDAHMLGIEPEQTRARMAQSLDVIVRLLNGEVVTEKALVLPANGVFAYDLGFDIRDPHQPVEIRLFLRKAAIEGVFLLRSVKVRLRRGPA